MAEQPDFNSEGSGSTPDSSSKVIGRIGPKYILHWCYMGKECPFCRRNRELAKRVERPNTTGVGALIRTLCSTIRTVVIRSRIHRTLRGFGSG